MIARDALVGVVGGLVLLSATIYVFYYKGAFESAPLLRVFEVSWGTHRENLPSRSQTTKLHETTKVEYPVEIENLTQLTLTFEWRATQGKDYLEIFVQGPAGFEKKVNESGGSAVVQAEGLSSIPPISTIEAGSLSEAWKRLEERRRALEGPPPPSGPWKVEVSFTYATGIVLLPGGPSLQPDSEVRWTLKGVAEHFEATLKERNPR